MMITLIAAALAAAAPAAPASPPAPPADAHAKSMQMGESGKPAKMDCCCCKDMAKAHDGDSSAHDGHGHR